MRIGVHLPSCRPDATPAATRTFARLAADLGYHRVWAWEHPDHGLDVITRLSFVAGATDDVALGGVLRVDARAAEGIGRSIRALSELTGARLMVGLGPTGGPCERVLDLLVPASDGGPRVLLPAATPAAREVVARRADGWLVDERTPVTALRAGRDQLAAGVRAAGRPPGALEVVARATVELEPTPTTGPERPRFHGSTAQVATDLAALREAGVDEVVLVDARCLGLDATLEIFATLADALALASADALRGAGTV